MKKITKREFLTTSALGSAALITGCGGGNDSSGGGGGSSSGSGKRQFVTIGDSITIRV